VLDLGKEIKRSCQKDGMLAWQYNTIGVSDGITMGSEGMILPIEIDPKYQHRIPDWTIQLCLCLLRSWG
jgi:hypothetical protein